MAIEKEYDMLFDNPNNERPYMIFPKVYSDNRGSFSEVLVGEDTSWIKQINRSISCQLTLRGMHAQSGAHCQAKLVEALSLPIYDIVTDARPDSKTFGTTAVYCLDPIKQNKLYVPHGCLHGFAVPKHKSESYAMFMYYCDETYCHDSEVHVNPMSVLPEVAKKLEGIEQYEAFISMVNDKDNLVLSDKDLDGKDYTWQMEQFREEYTKFGKLWYKA